MGADRNVHFAVVSKRLNQPGRVYLRKNDVFKMGVAGFCILTIITVSIFFTVTGLHSLI